MKKVCGFIMVAALVLGFVGCDLGGGDDDDGTTSNVAVPAVAVTGLSNMPATAYVNAETDLCSVAVTPANADRQTIVWTVKEEGGTGVTDDDLADKKFTPMAAGTLILTATVAGGNADGTDFTSDKTITVSASAPTALAGTVIITTNAIKGMMLEGVNVTGTLTNESGAPVYHWQRRATDSGPDSAWADIDGAYKLTYTLGNDDVGKYIRLKVSYSARSGFIASDAAGPVEATLPAVWKPESPINLSTDWTGLLTKIQTDNKYISLDLSECTLGDGVTEFDPGTNNTGESKILSLVLPSTATGIKKGSYTSASNNAPTFKNFTALTSVSGANITEIGEYSFRNCAALTTADFPKAETIGKQAFYSTALAAANYPDAEAIGDSAFYKTALVTANFPKPTTIGTSVFDDCAALTTVNLPLAETIGNSAFGGCAALATVSLPAAKSIGDSAFSGCAALKTVSIPLAETIGNSAFGGCAALKTVNLPLAKTVGEWAFSSAALTMVSLPEATSLGDYAFGWCEALQAVSLPKVETIGIWAFASNPVLTTVSLPAVKTIGDNAFSYNTALTSVSLPAGLTDLGNAVFISCPNLATITVDAGNAAYKAQNGMLLDKAGNTLVAYPSAKGAVTLDAAVKTIGDSAFFNTALTSVNAPEVETIGDSAFYESTALTTASLPKAKTIGSYAFEDCAALTSVHLPEMETINLSAFENTALVTVSFPKAKTVQTTAFKDCAALTSVNLPEATFVGASAFVGCTALASVNLSAVETIWQYAFEDTGVTPLTITLGSTAPATLKGWIFAESAARTVTVQVPSNHSGYISDGSLPVTYADDDTTEAWGNGFRGAGWVVNGTGGFASGNDGGAAYINRNIRLIIEVIGMAHHTYTSSAKGYKGDIKVSVSFSEENITGITIDEHNETITRPLVAYAIKNIPLVIVQSQSPEVDVISGATYTSKAIKEAVKNCVLEATKNT